MDNVGACSHHINNMKSALGDEHSGVLDSEIEKLNFMRQSFVWGDGEEISMYFV